MLKTITEKKRQETIPIWLMRQAGRYLPEYKEVRKQYKDFMEICYNSDLIQILTMQPIERFNLDAAIIFSDILVVPDVLGCKVKFIEGIGPKLKTISHHSEINYTEDTVEKLNPIFDGIRKVKKSLPKGKPLIGFAGSPWTVASYMTGKENNFAKIRQMCYSDTSTLESIIKIITKLTISYLIQQIKSGVDIIQLFDSHAGILPSTLFTKWVIEPTKEIVSHIKKKYPELPIIGFPKGAGVMYKNFSEETGVSVTSIDYNIPITWAKNNIKTVIQGNLDPFLLAYSKKHIAKEVEKIIKDSDNIPLIFNLGHGIIPDTPIENVNDLIQTVKTLTKN
ncbi:uroporphyrinogen decarboxylase [Neoehrlichia mikurensis]|uniref:Uroporphyrinogen decarboxylase n=2 Tax=Neoehrlichia mikurensis TaxID=89586 RepID=A0A9Q9F5S1_9RICK|nr:uroporphyrinogen decarboxylase [Neoehrlichia mikurensis]QXK92382.1 uroporphyrinogen decarboxylase [Neoehrlichia mikurensis]QXK93229.1 uroporphyrinogen decarboxylase [Neoehrlichia mikurensis]QXK94074.1 uroporphyrinogen decarboxylase [Neoehrlichia mikurensis]UTO55821.1 uroporphyrinogen decarboxylase [Neoehrlichia mikurensis]UTO56736.1 uroporphyrinogen decarboxylase [Neoehrlichia mikurensis]